MNNKLLIISLILVCLVIVTGCTGLMNNAQENNDTETDDLFEDFNDSMMEESDDVDLGLII